MEKVVLEVIKSECSFYQPGDRIYLDGALIDRERSGNICVMAISSFFPFVYAFRKGVTSEQMGFGKSLQVQCPDSCAPVVFEVKKEESIVT